MSCGVTIFTSHHNVITSSRSLQTGLLHQGVSRLLRHDDVDQSETVSKSADLRCQKMHFCSSESRESRIFGISALKTIVLRNKTKLFSTCNWSIMYHIWILHKIFCFWSVVWFLASCSTECFVFLSDTLQATLCYGSSENRLVNQSRTILSGNEISYFWHNKN